MSQDRSRPADWEAEKYSRVATPQRDWSGAVIDRLELKGDETVVDAGCGSGNVTEDLLERLPDGRVIGVDGSRKMVEEANRRLGDDPRAAFVCQDLAGLELDGQVDHVFSNATFHWIADHDRLFRSLAGVTRPGGRLVAQCGGRGNVADVVSALAVINREQPFAGIFGEHVDPWNFAGPEETEMRLLQAGYEDAECWLEDRVARPEDPRGFFEASFLAPAREVLNDEQFTNYTDRLLAEMGQPTRFNYVRLNITATRRNGNE
ncbi:MAG: methyltransferase domain-containing protein [Solirubrobacterales bacterium]|nr:methyltransferase domain-containing protein [Solirubrobacterales bacterium]HMT05188.1 methyltransferase domain-containing protein [Solirubrobacterales bacterium]